MTRGVPSDPAGVADVEMADDVVLRRSAAAYAAAGLAPKPSKRFRKEAVFNVVGARVDGRQGWVSAKIELILVALALSVQMVTSRTWSSSILATTNACWVQILLYRRAGFCLLERAYQAVTEAGPTDRTWRTLPPSVTDELLMLCLNVSSWGTDLRASVSPEVWCTDASGGGRPGVGGVTSELPRRVVQELWRHRVRRGGYVRKESSAEAAARRLEDFADDAVFPGELIEGGEVKPDGRWFGEVCDAIGWSPTFSYAPPPAHINIQELRGVRTLVRRLARSDSGPRRQLVGIDSNVVVGCLSKGRSSSRDLNRVLRSFLPEQVFADIYVGVLGVSSKQNPADAPSRRRRTRRLAVDAPQEWAVRFVHGDLNAISAVLPADTRFDWLPEIKLMRRTGYRGRRVGEASNPGPRNKKAVRQTDVDILSRPSVSQDEKAKRRRLILELRRFAASRGVDLATCFDAGPDEVADALRHFGQSLYQSGRSIGDFRTTINGVTDLRRSWSRVLTAAWDAVTAWELLEPVDHHIPVPKVVFRALFAAALLAHDTPFNVINVAGFIGGLRPGEALRLRRSDIVLPIDRGKSDGPVYLVVRKPGKAKRRGVQAQHAKIGDPDMVRFLTWALAGLPRGAPIWAASPSAFGNRWRLYVEDVLQLSADSVQGFCPAGLRAGCATELYEETHDLVLVQWQLRHADLATLQSYVQELPMAMSQASFTPEQEHRITRLSTAADLLLRRTYDGLEGSPIGAAPTVTLRRRRGVRRRASVRASSAPARAAQGRATAWDDADLFEDADLFADADPSDGLSDSD